MSRSVRNIPLLCAAVALLLAACNSNAPLRRRPRRRTPRPA